MRNLFLIFLLLISVSASAQDEMPDESVITYDHTNTTADPNASTQEVTEPASEMPAVSPLPPPPPTTAAPNPTYEQKKFAVLQTLDKLTARTTTITVPVGQATAIGPLFADIKTCQKTPPSEQPESAAFLQIWEAKPKPKLKKKIVQTADEAPSQWVFSGWMFASSPALSAMDHPVYDVWLKDCVNETAVSKQK